MPNKTWELITIQGIELLNGADFLAHSFNDDRALIFCGCNPQFDKRFRKIDNVAVNKKILEFNFETNQLKESGLELKEEDDLKLSSTVFEKDNFLHTFNIIKQHFY